MTVTLPELIGSIGDAPFAEETGVPMRTVQSWRRRERLPRPEQAREIIKLYPDRITFEGIYGVADSVAAHG